MGKNFLSKIARLGTAGIILFLLSTLFSTTPSKTSFAMMKRSQAYKVGNTTYVTIYAEGDRWNNQAKRYEAKYRIEKNPQVAKVYVQALSFYCENTRSDNVCSENGEGKHSEELNFKGGNTAYHTIVRYPNNPGNCGSFQADLRVVKIVLNDGTVYTDTSGINPGKTDINRFVWAGCNALNSNFNCGLPEDWKTSCSESNPTPTPTSTPTPTNPPATPTPTPQTTQNITQTVNVNQNVNIQNSANNQVLGASTAKELPKAGVETFALLSSLLAAGSGVIIRRKLL